MGQTLPMSDLEDRPLREIKYPAIKSQKEDFSDLQELSDEKKYDYRYWEKFLVSHKRHPLRWQILLIPLLLVLIAFVYHSKFEELGHESLEGPKSSRDLWRP